MRILRCYPFLPPLPGGMERHVLRLTQEQRHLGCEVRMAFNGGQPTSVSDIHLLPWVNLRKIRPQVLRDLMFYLCLIFKIRAEKSQFDVVHIHGDWSAFLFGRLLARPSKSRKLIASLHGSVRQGIWRAVYRFALRRYGFIYTTGAREAALLGAITERPVQWQHSGIDGVYCEGWERARVTDVVTVGSLVPQKNYGLVVEIAAAMPDIGFVVIGDGPQRCTIETQCRRRRISNITFTGYLTPAEVAQHMRNARIYLHTSFSEGTPTALLEAMACGLAVVTSQSNDYEELIQQGYNGFVIEGFQAEPYIERIRHLLSDKSRLHEISCRNSEQAMGHRWPEVAKRITKWSVPDAIDDRRHSV